MSCNKLNVPYSEFLTDFHPVAKIVKSKVDFTLEKPIKLITLPK